MKRGDVVIVDFPFTSGLQGKVRPAVVVQNDHDNRRLSKTIVAMVTGNVRRAGEPTHLLIDPTLPEQATAGLHAKSLVVCVNLFTIEQSSVLRTIGHYPAAVYGDKGVQDDIVNRLRRFSPRPCDSNAAIGFVEAWLDKGALSTLALFSRIWGMDHAQFLHKFFEQSEDDVDPSTMRTEVGRQMAAQVKRSLDDSQIRIHRLGQVLADYETYPDPLQQQLTAAAIAWACASLAAHEGVVQCEAYFYAVIDVMYAQSEDAKKSYDGSTRQRILVAAEAHEAFLAAPVIDISRSAMETIAGYAPDNTFRTTAQMLVTVSRGGYLDHVPRGLVRDLIARAVCLAVALDEVRMGIKGTVEVFADLAQLTECGQSIMDMVHALVCSGKLAVKNGEIVCPVCSQDPKATTPTAGATPVAGVKAPPPPPLRPTTPRSAPPTSPATVVRIPPPPPPRRPRGGR